MLPGERIRYRFAKREHAVGCAIYAAALLQASFSLVIRAEKYALGKNDLGIVRPGLERIPPKLLFFRPQGPYIATAVEYEDVVRQDLLLQIVLSFKIGFLQHLVDHQLRLDIQKKLLHRRRDLMITQISVLDPSHKPAVQRVFSFHPISSRISHRRLFPPAVPLSLSRDPCSMAWGTPGRGCS